MDDTTTRDAEYPLFPILLERGQEEAQRIMDKFKVDMKKLQDEALGELYVDVAVYIESDSWTNFRSKLMQGLTNYRNRGVQGEYDFARIRRAIYEEFKEEINKDLDQDLLKKVEELEATLKREREYNRSRL